MYCAIIQLYLRRGNRLRRPGLFPCPFAFLHTQASRHTHSTQTQQELIVIKPILAISFCALFLTACGGGGSSTGTTTGGGGTTGGGTGGGTTGGTNTNVGGQSGSFGDTAAAENGIDGTYAICPANVAGSFSSFTQNGSSWCVKKCPDNTTIENADGDEWATYMDGADRLTCRVTTAASGSLIEVAISAPIDGCPTGGCPTNSFPRVYLTASAGAEMAGNYTCVAWIFDQNAQVWEEQTSPAPFSVNLNADSSATIGGVSTTWSFANGALVLEGNRTLNNVAVGSGSFTSYDSNTALTRCST